MHKKRVPAAPFNSYVKKNKPNYLIVLTVLIFIVVFKLGIGHARL